MTARNVWVLLLGIGLLACSTVDAEYAVARRARDPGSILGVSPEEMLSLYETPDPAQCYPSRGTHLASMPEVSAAKGPCRPTPAWDTIEYRYLVPEQIFYADGKAVQPPLGADPGVPNLGISFSGGGVRSASFAIGAMKAFDELGILRKADILSSVSGGSYAVNWYYRQNYTMDQFCDHFWDIPPDKDRDVQFARWRLFLASCDPEGDPEHRFVRSNLFVTWHEDGDPFSTGESSIFQRYLEQASDIKSEGARFSAATNLFFLGIKIVAAGLTIPLNLLTNDIFDMDANVSSFALSYRNALDRNYSLTPIDSSFEHFLNPKRLGYSWAGFDVRYAARTVDFGTLKTYLKDLPLERRLPLFIMNGTATQGYSKSGLGIDFRPSIERPVNSRVFEMSPIHFGSDLYGYYDTGHLGNDLHCLDDRLKGCLGELHVSKAMAISGAAVDRTSVGPIAAGALEVLNLNLGHNVANPEIGWWERVLRWPLRLVPFPGYLVESSLFPRRPLNIRLSDGGVSENLAALALIRRGTRNVIIVDGEQDQESAFEGMKLLKETLARELGLNLKFKDKLWEPPSYWDVYHPRFSLLEGTITGFPPFGSESAHPIRVLYVKLSMDTVGPGGPSTYPYTVREYQRRHDGFPQESTADLSYSPQQFRAYRDLGYFITCTKKLYDFVTDGDVKVEDWDEEKTCKGPWIEGSAR